MLTHVIILLKKSVLLDFGPWLVFTIYIHIRIVEQSCVPP